MQHHGPVHLVPADRPGFLARAWGWAFVTRSHLAALSDQEILARGLGARAAEAYRDRERALALEFREVERTAEESLGELFARANAQSNRLGRTYRARVESEAVRSTVRASAQGLGGRSRLDDGIEHEGPSRFDPALIGLAGRAAE